MFFAQCVVTQWVGGLRCLVFVIRQIQLPELKELLSASEDSSERTPAGELPAVLVREGLSRRVCGDRLLRANWNSQDPVYVSEASEHLGTGRSFHSFLHVVLTMQRGGGNARVCCGHQKPGTVKFLIARLHIAKEAGSLWPC